MISPTTSLKKKVWFLKTNFKQHGGKVGELRTEDGKPANLNVAGLNESWNNSCGLQVRRVCERKYFYYLFLEIYPIGPYLKSL